MILDCPLPKQPFNFLWVELTNRCNLKCVHCYSSSSPWSDSSNSLSLAEYIQILDNAFHAGCRSVQFIGGEPTLNKGLARLIEHARVTGYDYVEVYTNLTRLSEQLVEIISANGASVATSFYSENREIHDSITQVNGSYERTIYGIQRLLNAEIPLRVGIVCMPQNEKDVMETVDFLKSYGVNEIRLDHVRKIGRGAEPGDRGNDTDQLCGSCWKGSLCVSPSGDVFPCIMARSQVVGSVRTGPVGEINASDRMHAVRTAIYAETTKRPLSNLSGIAASCDPDCVPLCNPKCSPNCSPCFPYGKCNPTLFG